MMLRQSIRRFTKSAYRAAELAAKTDMANAYGVQLAKAQTHVNGLVGGEGLSLPIVLASLPIDNGPQQLAILPSSASIVFPKRPLAKSTAKLNSRILEEV